eukprot:450236-Heterocapsa_arctica.AAC.1
MRFDCSRASRMRSHAVADCAALTCCHAHHAVHGRLHHRHTLLPAFNLSMIMSATRRPSVTLLRSCSGRPSL